MLLFYGLSPKQIRTYAKRKVPLFLNTKYEEVRFCSFPLVFFVNLRRYSETLKLQ